MTITSPPAQGLTAGNTADMGDSNPVPFGWESNKLAATLSSYIKKKIDAQYIPVITQCIECAVSTLT